MSTNSFGSNSFQLPSDTATFPRSSPTKPAYLSREFWNDEWLPVLEWVHSLGGVVFPNRQWKPGDQSSKAPLLKGWQNPENGLSVKESIDWLKSTHSISLALPSDIFVIDVDVPYRAYHGHNNDGRPAFDRLAKELGLDCATIPQVRGPFGGCHYYFRKPSELTIRGSLKGYRGIDIKGLGGYVVAPPSQHWTGHGQYSLSSESVAALPFLQAPMAPAALLEMLDKNSRMDSTSGSRSGSELGSIDCRLVEELLGILDPEEYQGTGNAEWL